MYLTALKTRPNMASSLVSLKKRGRADWGGPEQQQQQQQDVGREEFARRLREEDEEERETVGSSVNYVLL